MQVSTIKSLFIEVLAISCQFAFEDLRFLHQVGLAFILVLFPFNPSLT
jgi:hypothetical protein